MPYLGDYIGHLLSEIAIARFQVDLEAVRMAELYSSDSLLRHLPVPRFRLPTMSIDVPVAIKEMEEAEEGKSPRGGVVVPVLRERFDRILAAHISSANIDLLESEKRDLDRALDQTISRFSLPLDLTVSVLTIADELVLIVTKFLANPKREGKPIEPARLDAFTDELKTIVRLEFLKLREAPPRLNVLVTTAELREAGPAEFLARLHLSVSEEAVEWTVIESQGRSDSRLLPE